MRQEDTQVIVVGAGPIGMFTALLLAREKIKVRVIDQAPEVADQSYACALHGRSVKLLCGAGLGENLLKDGRRIDAIDLYEGAIRRARISVPEVTPSFPHLLTLSQSSLETLLEEKLRAAGVQLDWNHRLADLRFDNGGVTATVERLCGTATGYDVPRWENVVGSTFECSAQFVIGADGCHSVVRRLLGLDAVPVSKPQLFVVYEFESDALGMDAMAIVVNESDRNVFWPLPGQRCRWSFEWTDTVPDGEFPPKHRGGMWYEDQPIAERTRRHLQQLLETRAPWFSRTIGDIDWASDVQFEPYLVNQFGRGRCWLVGDAVHQTCPVGVQSMNIGFREVETLTHAISAILRGIGSVELLEAYEKTFRQEWLHILGANAPVATTGATSSRWRGDSTLLSCLPASDGELDRMVRSVRPKLTAVDCTK